MNKSDIISLKASDLIKAVLPVKGKPLDLVGYRPFELLYSISPPQLSISASRQIGKSLYISNLLISRAILTAHATALYVAPLSQQTSRFSTMYLDPGLNSPLVKRHFQDSQSRKNVFEKSLSNNSRIFLGYAENSAGTDRLRGISISGPGKTGAVVCLDEVQEMQNDALGIIFETMSAAEYPTKILTGTAKSEYSTLQRNFLRGSQCEWCIPCPHCGKWTIPKDLITCYKMVANKEGPGCVHCGKVLDVSKGQWCAGRPNEKNHLSFHLPAMIFPVRTTPTKWAELQDKLETYPASQVENEIFGLPNSEGTKLLSISECQNCTAPEVTNWYPGFPENKGILFTVLGVDWAVASSAKACHTAVSIMGFDMNGKMYLLYAQKLDGIDVLDQVKRVIELYHLYKCTAIGSDRGVGVPQYLLLSRHLGEDHVFSINYVTSKTLIRIDRQGGYFAADRTSAIDLLMFKAKAGREFLETPSWNLTEPYWNDCLNVFEETTITGRRIYKKLDDQYDDYLHSAVFAIIASQIVRGDFTEVDEAPRQDDVFNF